MTGKMNILMKMNIKKEKKMGKGKEKKIKRKTQNLLKEEIFKNEKRRKKMIHQGNIPVKLENNQRKIYQLCQSRLVSEKEVILWELRRILVEVLEEKEEEEEVRLVLFWKLMRVKKDLKLGIYSKISS